MRRTAGQWLVCVGMQAILDARHPTGNFGWAIAYLTWWAALALAIRSAR
jgi:hypothetical protein